MLPQSLILLTLGIWVEQVSHSQFLRFVAGIDIAIGAIGILAYLFWFIVVRPQVAKAEKEAREALIQKLKEQGAGPILPKSDIYDQDNDE